MLALFLQTLNVTAPVFAMLFLGYGLKRIEWINDNFIKTASALVFNVCMPSLLFLGIYHADLRSALKPGLLVYFVVATVGSFAIAWWIATKRCPEVDRGVFTQRYGSPALDASLLLVPIGVLAAMAFGALLQAYAATVKDERG